jgi:hypothetical protein
MDQQKTYQELLAEQFEENARDGLVLQNIQEDDDSYIEPQYANKQLGGYELQERDKYGQFAGNRNLEEDLVQTKTFEDKSKLSVRYNKDVKTHVLNIDSRFRAYAFPGISSAKQPSTGGSIPLSISSVLSTATSLSSHFIFRTAKQIRNAMSIKLTSLEMPNTFSNFLLSRGNTSFLIRQHGTDPWRVVTIPDGYYRNAEHLASAVQTAVQSVEGLDNGHKIECSANDDGLITFEIKDDTVATAYDFDFSTSPFTFNSSTTGSVVQTQLFETLGQSLGFDITNTYTNITLSLDSLTGTYIPDVNPDKYIYLKLNDYSTVTPQSINDTYYSVFSKIPITVSKGLMIIDNESTNSTTKEYRFLQPTNIQQVEIQLLDMSGTEIVFKQNFSMTLEVEEVVSHSLYEKLREL